MFPLRQNLTLAAAALTGDGFTHSNLDPLEKRFRPGSKVRRKIVGSDRVWFDDVRIKDLNGYTVRCDFFM